ncbi:B12-binding domain-containing radical SAM protein [Flavobacterium sp. J49]|uniref:B12-binding domain-containing radical SAM protein n=1 Tax=Flavobacterium sp. J49 TaxID=2718534 RepID=UPI001593264C|nr:radical SAM protein [Flavobacterium sp. J49]MBF6641191.1 B12-binding domain-containing radical SAM protein [Flavobacterium sp. J49]NIC02438.1 B12-binding domain-containing radical SAM protein [Flavobacterium sp. J49]
MSNILFSHSYYYKLDPKQWKNKTPFPPLGTLYAASLMRENGFDVSLFDTNLLDSPNTIGPVLKSSKPNYLVIYDDGFNYLTKMCLTNMREACFEMIRLGKIHNCTIIVCSSDSTDHYQDYLKMGADYILQGEGEMSLLELINALENETSVDHIKGIVFKKNGQVQVNSKREVLQNLDELPLPAWDLVDIESYHKVWKQSGQPFTLNIATTRGCPYKCNWCAKPIYGNRYNAHSPDYIVKEIQFLKDHFGVTRFWMCDDIFGLKPNWVQDFNLKLKEQNLKISYYIQSRVDLLLKEDTIDCLAESGLEEVWVGAESASQKILDAMDKGTTVEQIYQATKILKDKKVRVAFFLQFGYLTENQEDIAKTIAMVKELMPDNIGISVSYPLPGTKFYDKVKDDLKLKSNWTDSDDFEMMFHGTYKSNYYRKLQRYVHKEFRKQQGFYNLKQVFSKPSNVSVSHLKSIAKLGYYVPSAFLDTLSLKKLQQNGS